MLTFTEGTDHYCPFSDPLQIIHVN